MTIKFAGYKNVHKTPLSTGRIKINIDEVVPDKYYSDREIECLADWASKGYLVALKEDVVEIPEATEAYEVPEVQEVETEVKVTPKKSKKKNIEE